MISTQAHSQLNDRELVTLIHKTEDKVLKQEAEYSLYRRYDKFVHKHWHGLRKQLHLTPVLAENVKDDFYGESFEIFRKALTALKLEKIENDKWKFLGYYGFYLRNFRNKVAKEVIRKNIKERRNDIEREEGVFYLSDLSDQGTSPSVEDNYLVKDEQTRILQGIAQCRTSLWSDQKNKIFELRAQNKSIQDISTQLKISAWKCSKLLKEMKVQLNDVIEKVRT